MCTAAIYKTRDTYFGRNLDLDYSYHETITVTPRKFPLKFRMADTLAEHFAMIGVAFVMPDATGADYPLYYDAINEKGVGIVGLNFVKNAAYFPAAEGRTNITPFELIPWVLGQCSNLAEAKALIGQINLLNQPFSPELPLAELHWLVTDVSGASFVLESTQTGLHIYDNPVGVLTNNPEFPAHLSDLNNYLNLSASDPANSFPLAQPDYYSRGLGSHFLPGGFDSHSRFVRACFVRANSTSSEDELSSISQYFHIMNACDQPRGCDLVTSGEAPINAPATEGTSTTVTHPEITVYTSGYNLNQGLAYYTTYDNHQISCVDMKKTDLDAERLTSFPMIESEQVNYQN